MFSDKKKFAREALLLLSSAWLFSAVGCGKKAAPPPNGPMPVNVRAVEQRDVPIYGDWLGTLDGYVNAQIQPQVSGYLIKQNYKEGSVVNAGEILFEIDPRPLQATLDQAKGQVAQARAQLQLTKINVKRDKPLAEAHAVAQSQLDTELQQEATAEAAVQTAEAAVEQAQLNLNFTQVRSLITGIAGQAQTQVGNLVSPTTTLTSVSQVEPIKVFFAISEQEYLALSRRVKAGGKSDLLNSGNAVSLQLTLANGKIYPYPGRIVFVDRQVNTQTGTLRIAGSFPNRDNLLRPGQFGRIKAETEVRHGALLIPAKAVNELQGSYQVAVVNPDNTVHIQNVTLGPEIGSEWIITSGIQPDERVVTEGILKLRDGMQVLPQQAPADDDTTAGHSDAAPKGN